MSKLKLGLGVCGSYCTYEKLYGALDDLCRSFEVQHIMTKTAAETDTRFGKAADHIKKLEEMTGKQVLTEISQVEPLGPSGAIEAMLIAPCTGNTLAKLASGITDSSVTMAAKGLLRNGKPIILAISTNDGLSGSAENIAKLLNKKNIYFVPFAQDDPVKKPTSLVADFDFTVEAIESAVKGQQIQPLLAK